MVLLATVLFTRSPAGNQRRCQQPTDNTMSFGNSHRRNKFAVAPGELSKVHHRDDKKSYHCFEAKQII
jgi:hypothetical protein